MIMEWAMLSCKEASRLSSLSLDQRLTFWQRAMRGMHIGMCSGCAAFSQQISFLSRAAKADPPSDRADDGAAS